MNFGVCDFSRFADTDWRLRRWRLCFLALMTATLYASATTVILFLQQLAVASLQDLSKMCECHYAVNSKIKHAFVDVKWVCMA